MAGLIYLFSSRRLFSIFKVLFKKVEKKAKIRNRYNKVPTQNTMTRDRGVAGSVLTGVTALCP